MKESPTKQTILEQYRKNISVAGLSTVDDDSIICPLCWRETNSLDLSREHIIPGSVGGTLQVLTCRSCNNSDGSNLDAHLSQYQTVVDSLQGHGVLKTKINVNNEVVAANLDLSQGKLDFTIIGKASNPAASAAIKKHCESGNVDKINCELYLNHNKNNFQTAVLRAAYLIAFKFFGYEYVIQEVVQKIRKRIANPSLESPSLASLIFELRNFVPPNDAQQYIFRRHVNEMEFIMVIIRVRKQTTTYLGSYLPLPNDCCEGFYERMEQIAKKNDGETLTIPSNAFLI